MSTTFLGGGGIIRMTKYWGDLAHPGCARPSINYVYTMVWVTCDDNILGIFYYDHP